MKRRRKIKKMNNHLLFVREPDSRSVKLGRRASLKIIKIYNIIYIENKKEEIKVWIKELFVYNMVRLFRNKGYNDDQIADAMQEIIKEVEEKVNG